MRSLSANATRSGAVAATWRMRPGTVMLTGLDVRPARTRSRVRGELLVGVEGLGVEGLDADEVGVAGGDSQPPRAKYPGQPSPMAA